MWKLGSLASILLLAACLDHPVASSTATCTSCHGNAANPTPTGGPDPAYVTLAAPPDGLGGNSDPTYIGVGAHQAHLLGGTNYAPLACNDCHKKVPTTVDAPGHVDPWPAEVDGDAISATPSGPDTGDTDLATAWNHDSATCTVYCHGTTIGGGAVPSWVWNAPSLVDTDPNDTGDQIDCADCHGMPPANHSPTSTQCENCHAPTAGPNHTIANLATHIDGIVTLGAPAVGATCAAGCHGTDPGGAAVPNDDAHNAPPVDTLGNSDPLTAVGVGAHQAHLGSAMSTPVACSACHTVPNAVDDAGHDDTPLPAEVAWDELARTDGAFAPYVHQDTNPNCTVYCHGSTATGALIAAPGWNKHWAADADGDAFGDPNDTTSSCKACHGWPPPSHATTDTACTDCHEPTGGTGHTFVDVTQHVDGAVTFGGELGTNCAPCHSVSGFTSPAPATGAHQAHLLSGMSAPIACSSCHQVPATFGDPSAPDHDNGTTEVHWDALAASGASPWSTTTPTCTVYCHGATLTGGANTAPEWAAGNDVANTACDSCHGAPPPSPHPNVANCSQCHGSVVDANGAIIDPSKHINGTVDF